MFSFFVSITTRIFLAFFIYLIVIDRKVRPEEYFHYNRYENWILEVG